MFNRLKVPEVGVIVDYRPFGGQHGDGPIFFTPQYRFYVIRVHTDPQVGSETWVFLPSQDDEVTPFHL